MCAVAALWWLWCDDGACATIKWLMDTVDLLLLGLLSISLYSLRDYHAELAHFTHTHKLVVGQPSSVRCVHCHSVCSTIVRRRG